MFSEMNPLHAQCIHLLNHDYITSQRQDFISLGCQTEMTMADIKKMEETVNQTLISDNNTGEDIVIVATDSDEKVNYYTGLETKTMLYHMYVKLNFII